VHVKRTDNGGGKWTDMPIGDFALATNPTVIIMAVSPTNPDVLYARSQNANPPAGDKLYRSADGGASWKLVLDTVAPVATVVFLADGTVLVGTVMAAWQSAPDGVTFTQLDKAPQMLCGAQRADGTIFACGANWDPDYAALGTSAPAPIGGWTKMFRFVDMAGPLSCPAGTVQKDVCELQLWQMVKEQYGIKEPDGAPPPDAPAPAKKPSGCCDASGDGLETAVVLVLAIGIGGLLIRRGKKKKKDCCQ
jgi:hypothetical protein